MQMVENRNMFPSGLTEEQVAQSRAEHGENRLSQVDQQSLLSRFIENFGDPIIKILLVALGINLIFALNHQGWYETAGIALAILLATWMSTISMYRSESAFQRLQEEASRVSCRVRRAGGTALVPISDIVMGDVVLLQAGERVPADGEIVSGELDVDQSSLNGETKEAHKMPGRGRDEDGFKHPSRLFSGSVVCAGEGVMRVSAVGDGTFLGHLAGEIQEQTRESPLKLRLGQLAETISKFGTLGAVLVAIADLINIWVITSGLNPYVLAQMWAMPGFAIQTLLHAITLAVTVIVVAVPEGLPMMITVVLSANMRRMLKDHVLVRNMTGIETAGNIDVLFTDKTGTLTAGQLRVARVVAGDGAVYQSASEAGEHSGFWQLLHASLVQNNAAQMVDGKPAGGNSTDRALLSYAMAAASPAAGVRAGVMVPFSSDAKFMATAVSGDVSCTLVKGAPERILPHCTHYVGADGAEQALSGRTSLERAVSEMARSGMRVLAAATSAAPVDRGGAFHDLALVALIGVRDPLRPEASQSVEALESAGVHVVMITGDGKETAEAIARDAGMLHGPHALVMTSQELGQLSDEALGRALPELKVVARALPADKSRLVDVAQRRGGVVGMTGDGVNDSPALKKADIGFAMGSGTEVAKEAGDIVILDDNLASVAKAVLYGRTIFRSIRKFIVFQLTVNVCAVGLSIICPLIGFDAPITVLQMLWVNMVMDTLAALAFSGEPALSRYMKKKPLKRTEPLISREMWGQIVLMGALTGCLCLFVLQSQWSRAFFRPETGGQVLLTAFFAVFMYAGIFNSASARTDSVNLFDHILGNKAFVAVMAFVFLVQTCLIYVGGALFRTCPLTLREWLACIGLAALVIPADLVRKAVRRGGVGVR